MCPIWNVRCIGWKRRDVFLFVIQYGHNNNTSTIREVLVWDCDERNLLRWGWSGKGDRGSPARMKLEADQAWLVIGPIQIKCSWLEIELSSCGGAYPDTGSGQTDLTWGSKLTIRSGNTCKFTSSPPLAERLAGPQDVDCRSTVHPRVFCSKPVIWDMCKLCPAWHQLSSRCHRHAVGWPQDEEGWQPHGTARVTGPALELVEHQELHGHDRALISCNTDGKIPNSCASQSWLEPHAHIKRAKRALGRLELGRPLQTAMHLHMSLWWAITPANVIGPAADRVLPSVVAASSVAAPQWQLTCKIDGLHCYMN